MKMDSGMNAGTCTRWYNVFTFLFFRVQIQNMQVNQVKFLKLYKSMIKADVSNLGIPGLRFA